MPKKPGSKKIPESAANSEPGDHPCDRRLGLVRAEAALGGHYNVMPSRHGGKVGDRAMTLQGHYLSRIAARSVASQCFELGLIVVTPMAQARVSTRTIVAAVISNAPVSTPASRSRV